MLSFTHLKATLVHYIGIKLFPIWKFKKNKFPDVQETSVSVIAGTSQKMESLITA